VDSVCRFSIIIIIIIIIIQIVMFIYSQFEIYLRVE